MLKSPSCPSFFSTNNGYWSEYVARRADENIEAEMTEESAVDIVVEVVPMYVLPKCQ